MNDSELKVHGSLFLLLQKFIEASYGKANWEALSLELNPTARIYEMQNNYPAEEIFSMINAVAVSAHISKNEVLEKFGEYMVPDLLRLYATYVNPTWKTFEMLENTEPVMHTAVRSLGSKADPPILHVTKVNERLLIIDYYSRRKMASLAVGIIRGIAKHYNETDKVRVIEKSSPNDERVQIRVEFDN